MIAMNNIYIKDVTLTERYIVIYYSGPKKFDAWLEDRNKHYPYIQYLNVDFKNSNISLEFNDLFSFLERYTGHEFKLSFCTENKLIIYNNSISLKNFIINGIHVNFDKNNIYFSIVNGSRKNITENDELLEISHKNKHYFENISSLPINVLCIGSCFSRSIFRSESYFNPMYNHFFNVRKTLFHNSFISLFSNSIEYDYSKIDDLITGDASKYIDIEFKKNMNDVLISHNFKLIIIDNYIDATTPVVKFSDSSYLTYNKYFSESIFKRFFSSCDIVFPGTKKHLNLYRKSIISFGSLIKKHNISNLVLIGCRLSKYKIDEESLHTEVWDDKKDWITSSNNNWEKVDEIFISEIPSVIYLDKRKSLWKSDVHTPITGGASPSHFQSGYYKELFCELKRFILRRNDRGL